MHLSVLKEETPHSYPLLPAASAMAQEQHPQQERPHQRQNPETFAIVVHYTDERLQRDGFQWTDRPEGRRQVDGQLRPFPDASPEIHATMRRVTTEFEQRFAEAFQELGGQLEIDRESAYQTFQGILGATFQDGVSWGRIVALMCLSGALAAKCVALRMPELGKGDKCFHFIKKNCTER